MNGLDWCTSGMNLGPLAGTAADDWGTLPSRETTQELETRFALLVERQSRFVFRIAYAVLRNPEDAEDVVQETFLKLFRTGAWKQIENEKAFLARTAWRLAIGRTRPRVTNAGWEEGEIVSEERSPELAAIATDRDRTIHRLIDALPERLRRPLALSTLEELTAAEIAVLMDLPEGTVRRLMVEARSLLKQKLARLEGRTNG